MKRKMQLKEEHFFLIAICIVFIVGICTFIKKPQEISISENRTLAQFKPLTLSGFMSGKFQNNFENALSDQFLMSEQIRVYYNKAVSELPTLGMDQEICKNRYLTMHSVDYPRATYNCGEYMLFMPQKIGLLNSKMIAQNVERYNHLNSLVDTYYFVINNSLNFDFEKNEKSLDFVKILSDGLQGNYKIASLEVNSYEDYKNLFSQTDHHWDYRGVQAGLEGISKLLGFKTPTPTGTFTSPEYSYGSAAKSTKSYNNQEPFTVYLYDIPPHKTIINGEAGKYSRLDKLVNHEYTYNLDTNFYWFYGDNNGEIIFDFDQPSKDNLLILSNSFSNPLNEVIAQYFNKTFVLDLRNYKKDLGKDFILSTYLKDHKIDKVLVLADTFFLSIDEGSNQGVEL